MPPPSVVLDTNVVVSAHLNSDGFERYVLDLALARKVRLVISREILSEYQSVLARKKFGFDPRLVARSLQLIREAGRLVNPSTAVSACPDAEDNKFLECAQEANVHYLVTGNKRHFPKRWRRTSIVNAREFISDLATTLQR